MNITLRGVDVNYTIAGEGPDVLLLHGWMGSTDSFAPITMGISDSYRVIALDFPGQGGKTPPPPEVWGVDEHMELVAAFIQEMKLNPVFIAAHSFGARVAIMLAAKRPELVKRMLLTGAAGLIPKRSPRYYIKVYSYKFAKAVFKLFRIDTAKLAGKAGSSDYKQLSGVMRGVFVKVVNQDLKSYLNQIKSPVFLFWGENDDQTPLAFAHTMMELIPDAGIATYERAGHFAYLERSGEFIAVLKSFFSEAVSK